MSTCCIHAVAEMVHILKNLIGKESGAISQIHP